MARKQTSKRLNRFLDLIGLVDSEHDEAEQEAPVRTARNAGSRRATADDFDEFADFEDPAPVRQRRNASVSASASRRNSRVNLENDEDEFGESQGWTNASPGYGSRNTRQRSMPSFSRNAAARNDESRGTPRYSSYSERRTASNRREAEPQPRYRSQSAGSGYSSQSRRGAGSYEATQSSSASPVYQRHQTVIFMLHSVDECKELILSLIDKKSVLMNLDELDASQAQRALDTMSGATYAIGATLSRASDRTWLITPSNVEVERSSLDNDDGYGGYGRYN